MTPPQLSLWAGRLWAWTLAGAAALLLVAVISLRVSHELWGDVDEMTGSFPASLADCIDSLGLAHVRVPSKHQVLVRQGDVWRITNTCA
jgi:hypothetical protein